MKVTRVDSFHDHVREFAWDEQGRCSVRTRGRVTLDGRMVSLNSTLCGPTKETVSEWRRFHVLDKP